MKRRLFIAINLDQQARRAIGRAEEDIEDAFSFEQGKHVRFMPEENWHITISFLGTQDDADLTAIMEAIRGTVKDLSDVTVSFTEITYAPQAVNPRMIWLCASRETSRALGTIKDALDYRLAEAGVRFERESRAFSGHITLARFQGAALGGLPSVERELKINCTGTSLDLMESELSRNGAEYTVLQKFSFSNEK